MTVASHQPTECHTTRACTARSPSNSDVVALPAEDEGKEMRKLRAEMHRRMLANSYCARPVELDCHFESICESCTFFVTTIEFRPTLQAQRDDATNKDGHVWVRLTGDRVRVEVTKHPLLPGH